MKPSLGRLEPVKIRSVFESEPADFTPWLADQENITLLGETLGLNLEVQGQEENVGPYRADILCKDVETDSWVLIENQLERSDHTHLGQLMTYAAGLEAVTIVWLARSFSDQHRAALDWLNEITESDYNFFAVEIELWSISGSPPAPRYSVVARPNDWSRSVKSTARELTAGPNGTARVRLEYWRVFLEDLEIQDPEVPIPKANTLGNLRFSLRGQDLWITVFAAASLKIMGVFMKGHTDDFPELLRQRHTIETEFGEELQWTESAGPDTWRIALRSPFDPTDRENWPGQHQWLSERLNRFLTVVKPRIAGFQSPVSSPPD